MKELGGTNGISRRDFLRNGLVFGVGAQALASGYAAVPDVFARAVLSAKSAAVQNDKVLVMIQLGGGNDGLQTVIPISSSQYRDFRPQLSAAAAKAQPISNDVGLHENLKGIKTLYDAGKVAIVQGVGYTNPSFSHFDSIRVWRRPTPRGASRTAGSARRSRRTTTRRAIHSWAAPAARQTCPGCFAIFRRRSR